MDDPTIQNVIAAADSVSTAPTTLLTPNTQVSNSGSLATSLGDVDMRMRWWMRWFFAVVISIGFLASIGAGIVIMLLAKNPLPLVIPSSLLLTMRPILRWLFPQEQMHKKS